MEQERNRVCPVEYAAGLDSKIRKWLQNPQTILAPYLREGMKALDVGCGPGFFSIEMARLVGRSGTVISADLQAGMLEILRNKIRGTELEARIRPVLCEPGSINVSEKVDFILAFYMVHEVPDKNSFFRQLHAVLNNGGKMLLVEPKMFHVSRKEFARTTRIAADNGFSVSQGPKLSFSWSAVLEIA